MFRLRTEVGCRMIVTKSNGLFSSNSRSNKYWKDQLSKRAFQLKPLCSMPVVDNVNWHHIMTLNAYVTWLYVRHNRSCINLLKHNNLWKLDRYEEVTCFRLIAGNRPIGCISLTNENYLFLLSLLLNCVTFNVNIIRTTREKIIVTVPWLQFKPVNNL